MNRQEYRIGNLVLSKRVTGKLEPHQICRGDYIDYLTDESHKPIRLTEDWLLRMGFDTHKKHDQYLENQVYMTMDAIYYVAQSFEDDHGCWNHCEFEVKHVHQLQNLYYALTQKELKIEDEKV